MDAGYIKRCENNINLKSGLTRWSDDCGKTFDTEDYTDIMLLAEPYGERINKQLINYEKNFFYNIETTPFYSSSHDLIGAVVYDQKFLQSNVAESVVNNTINIKDNALKLSIASYAFHKKGGCILLNNFDPKGRAHLNNFDYLPTDIDKLFHAYYFGEYGDTPHFHFNTREQDIALKRPNAISVTNIVRYLKDLIYEGGDYLNTHSMGMPFLKIKNMNAQYVSYLDTCVRGIMATSNNEYVNDFFQFLLHLYPATSSRGINSALRDFSILADFAKFSPNNIHIISEMGNCILCSLNDCNFINKEVVKKVAPAIMEAKRESEDVRKL